MRDIIDEIDALVDEQLSAYDSRSGYDHNVNQERCWHCGREWHGLKITERMQTMRSFGEVDAGYRYADDNSEILCPGSNFIGPTQPANPSIHAIDLIDLLVPPVSVTELLEQILRDALLGLEVDLGIGLLQQVPTAGLFQQVTTTFAPEPEPDPRTPQERALPRPSPTPPMWAAPITRRHNRQARHGR
ncbi:hypothetical protein ACIQYW_18970 [Rhodococcus erythropolis]|uniref:hypothetical protein n=1 Tax=Actinomycetes TaxID=1760 RepID=UPI003326B35E